MKKLRVQPAFCDLPKVTHGGSGPGMNEHKSVQPLSLCPLLPTECLQRGRGAAAGPWGGHEGAAVGQARESTQRDRGQEERLGRPHKRGETPVGTVPPDGSSLKGPSDAAPCFCPWADAGGHTWGRMN